MPEPISTFAATTAIIGAASATIGTANTLNTVAHTGGGFIVSATGLNYPHEITDQQLVGARSELHGRVVIKFHAEGGYWNDDLAIGMGGFVSNNNDPIVVYPTGTNPTVPANRFANLHFFATGTSDVLSTGHLDVTITPYERVLEPAWDPKFVFHVGGRFDPTGPGDTNYSFTMYVDTYGNVSMADASSTQAHITDEGDYILVAMDSREAWGIPTWSL
jgi:hypothetical protein